jgi:hypothetical protein
MFYESVNLVEKVGKALLVRCLLCGLLLRKITTVLHRHGRVPVPDCLLYLVTTRGLRQFRMLEQRSLLPSFS